MPPLHKGDGKPTRSRNMPRSQFSSNSPDVRVSPSEKDTVPAHPEGNVASDNRKYARKMINGLAQQTYGRTDVGEDADDDTPDLSDAPSPPNQPAPSQPVSPPGGYSSKAMNHPPSQPQSYPQPGSQQAPPMQPAYNSPPGNAGPVQGDYMASLPAQTPAMPAKPQGRRRKPSKVNTVRSAIARFYSPVIDPSGAGFLIPILGGSALLMEPELIAPEIKKLVQDCLDEDVSDRHVKDALESLYLEAAPNFAVENGRTWLNHHTGERFIDIDGAIQVFPLGQENFFQARTAQYHWRLSNQHRYSLQHIQGPSAYAPANIRLLAEHVQLPDERDLLLYAFMVLCMMPEREALALELTGEVGNDGPHLQAMIKTLVDPVVRKARLRAVPTRVKALDDLAWQHHVLSFDQLETPPTPTLQRRLYEFLCTAELDWKASTGRRLAVSSLRVRRVCLFSSQEPVVSQRELRERTFSLEMPSPDRPDASVNAVQRQWNPYGHTTIFAGLLSLLGQAHARIDTVTLPRQVPSGWQDFCKIGTVVAEALTGNQEAFWAQYDAYVEERGQDTLEQDPVAQAIQQYLLINDVQTLIEKSVAAWQYAIDDYRPAKTPDKEWPQSLRGMGAALKLAAPLLKAHGVKCYSNGKRGSRCRWVIGYNSIARQHG